MRPYCHTVQYYETDMMGVTHHANYIHWMEEARIDFMDQLGFPYAEMEAHDVFSPVKSLRCDYKKPTTFGDRVEITVSVASFNGVVIEMDYAMRKDGEMVCTARSEHCFLNRAGHFVRLRLQLPAFCTAIEALCRNEATVEAADG